MIERIKWLGHASFRIEADIGNIYIDPWEIKSPKEAKIILVTHSHFDHCSKEDIARISQPSTQIVAPPDCKTEIAKFGQFIEIGPGEEKEISAVIVKAVPAYNIGKNFHPKANGWVGYILEIEGTKIYHSGDTDLIPEMEGLGVDIALLPIGGTYTMNAEEAAEAASKIGAKIAIPMHYGKIVGSEADVERFKARLSPEVELKVLPITE